MKNQHSEKTRYNRLHVVVATLVFAVSFGLIFYITGVKVNQYGHSDPLLTLPTAQAIIQNGTPYLTHLEAEPIAPNGRILGQVINNYQAAVLSNNEIVDIYSPGPALLITPLVFLLDRAGFNLTDINTNLAVQNRIAFLTSAIALFSLFVLCLTKLEIFPALIVAHITYFGSAMFANMGLAYFNINFTIVFIIWALIGLSRLESDLVKPRFRHWAGVLIGLSLFLAFIQRPSASVLIVLSFGYLLLNHRRVAFWAMGTSAVGLAMFVGWSWITYGDILPIYYETGRTPDLLPLWVGLLGNLISPSRGLFFTMPWLLLIPIMWFKSDSFFKRDKLGIWVVVWGLLLFFTISTSVIWWGGASFGARLLAEFLPGLILIGITLWAENQAVFTGRFKNGVLVSFFALGLISVWAHSYQPFFNVYTGGPWQNSITGYPTRDNQNFSSYFSIKYSQILMSNDRACELREELSEDVVPSNPIFFEPLEIGEPINLISASQYSIEKLAEVNFSGDGVLFFPQSIYVDRFLINQGETILSTCAASRFYFLPTQQDVANGDLSLTLFVAEGSPRFGAEVNHQPIDDLTADEDGRITITIDTALLNLDEANFVELTMPKNQQVVLSGIQFDQKP